MSGTTDKVTGVANTAIGNVKQAVGKAIGSDKIEAGGIVQEVKAEAQKAADDAKEVIKHGANKVSVVILRTRINEHDPVANPVSAFVDQALSQSQPYGSRQARFHAWNSGSAHAH